MLGPLIVMAHILGSAFQQLLIPSLEVVTLEGLVAKWNHTASDSSKQEGTTITEHL